MAIIKSVTSQKDTREADFKGTPTIPEGTTLGIIEKVETNKDEEYLFITMKCIEAKAANVPANLLRPAMKETAAETSSPLPAEAGKSYKKSVKLVNKPAKVKSPDEIAQNYGYKAMVDCLCGLFRVGVGQEFDASDLLDRAVGEKQELRGRTLKVETNRFKTGSGNVKTNWSWEVLAESAEDIADNMRLLEE